jgi:ABC-2 type transport system ATP-binding protein
VRTAEQCGIADRMLDPIGILSKGLRQRVGLAQAMLPDPEMLILDEPTSGLDPNQIVEIRNIVRELGKTKTVILSTHILSEVERVCGRAIIVNQGRIVADSSLDELRGQLKGGGRYVFAVTPEAAGPEAERLEALKALSGVAAVESRVVAPNEPPWYVLTASTDGDLRPTLRQMAADKGWPLLELHREVTTLEQVFVRLTQESEAAGAGN